MEMLLTRGARINATNMGDDTALHLAASHGHRDIVLMVSGTKGGGGINCIGEGSGCVRAVTDTGTLYSW